MVVIFGCDEFLGQGFFGLGHLHIGVFTNWDF